MTIERICLKVVSSIGGIRFVAYGTEKVSIENLKKTVEYSYEIGEILDVFAEKKNDMGAVTYWRVASKGHSDIIINANELNAWRHECVMEIPLAA